MLLNNGTQVEDHEYSEAAAQDRADGAAQAWAEYDELDRLWNEYDDNGDPGIYSRIQQLLGYED